MLIHVTRGKLKHVRGRVINTFRAGDVFVESNNGGEHYVQNIGKKPAILHVGVISVVGVPTTITNKILDLNLLSILIIELIFFKKNNCNVKFLHY